MQFSLKDLFWIVTLSALCISLWCVPLPDEPDLPVLQWFSSGTLIGGALGSFCGRRWFGAWLGFCIVSTIAVGALAVGLVWLFLRGYP